MFSVLTLISFSSLFFAEANDRCPQYLNPQVPKYYLTEKCYKSKLGVLTKVNFISLISCQRLAIEKRGLAFNFVPPEVVKELEDAKRRVPRFTCEILKCAESEAGLSLVNDTRYDYYSLYAKPLPSVNATCVPGIGEFSMLKKQNFTLSELECRNQSGSLANVMSEYRTDAIAQLLVGAGIDIAFVGLSSNNGSDFQAATGDYLDCSTYRAWEPGHPKRIRNKFGCVGITKARTWRTVPCAARLPSVCELNPGGPYQIGSLLASRQSNDTSIQSNNTDTNRRP